MLCPALLQAFSNLRTKRPRDSGAKKTWGMNPKDTNDTEKNEPNKASNFRRALPQFLATSAKNLILLDLGMTLAFPTLVIPALLNSNGRLSFDTSLASWFGSVAFICQPLGSVFSGTVLEPLGRKKSMLLVNVPHLLGWVLFYYAPSLPILFIASIMMGLGVGFMEAPVITYVGEISEPRLRGILTSYSGLFVTLGLIAELTLGTVYDWNTAAFVSSFVPIITFIAISQVPETPMWLLSKGRIKEAEKALCWLRGWVPPAAVQEELNELIRYSNASKLVLKDKKPPSNNKQNNLPTYNNPLQVTDDPPNYDQINQQNRNGIVTISSYVQNSEMKKPESHGENMEKSELPEIAEIIQERKPTLWEYIEDMMRPQMLRPLSLVIAFFVFHNGSGFPAMRPYMVKIFEELRFPVDAHWSTVVTSIIGFLGVIVCTILVRYSGKRVLTLTSLAGCSISILSLALWTYLDQERLDSSPSWTPFVLFLMLSFSFSFGIAPIPWMILSEVFPFRGRGFASGLAAAISYIMGFITSKTFLDLKRILGLPGVFCIYGAITTVGIGYVYFKLPETEGRSLEDIENYYKTKGKNKCRK